MTRYILIILFTTIAGIFTGAGQLSDGGTPRRIHLLKKGSLDFISMPRVSNDVLRWEAEQLYLDSELKPLRFAHTFQTEFDPLNSGTWTQSDDGWWVWQLHIHSEDAYSLNLIFESFNPARHDRLFLFSPGFQNVIGAFGAHNITDSGVFPTAPVTGDELVVQFESPLPPGQTIPFKITSINHDFLGITQYVDRRRQLGAIAAPCIPDVNCDLADRWREVQNSVCRIQILGKEFCTGTLINNTAKDQRPFVLTANHCISTSARANTALFLFNYESPYCGPLDGDVTNSLSGSTLRATHDSLDVTLVELSVKPPPSFRPYYAGWSRSASLKDTVATIHHSVADIKKISLDNDIPVISGFGSAPSYTPNGFWRVNRWEYGIVEQGASGGPLFNVNSQVIGSLVGGLSRCDYPFNEYFTRFGVAWERNPNIAKQLKHWLDPLNLNPTVLEGQLFNQGPDFCKAFTNLQDGDTHGLTRSTGPGGANEGFITGTNSVGISEVGEKFKIPGDERLRGVSIGIGRRFMQPAQSNSRLKINVYDLINGQPEIIHTQQVLLNDLVADAMNYIFFTETVEPADSFLVAFSFENIMAGDSIAIYHSSRTANSRNSMYLKRNNQWNQPGDLSFSLKAGALALEVLACNVSSVISDTTNIKNPLEVKLYPNPTVGNFQVSSSMNLSIDMISVYNIRGQQISFKSTRLTPRKMEIDLSGNIPGIYLVRVWDGVHHFAGKVILSR